MSRVRARYPATGVISAGLIVVLAACGGSGDNSMTSSASPSPSPPSAPAPSAPAPSASAAPTTSQPLPSPEPSTGAPAQSTAAGAPAADLGETAESALAPYADLVGQPLGDADIGRVLPLFDGDVPLPKGVTIAGAGQVVKDWDGEIYVEQILGLAEGATKKDLEAFSASPPEGWTANSITTTDTSANLVMTRDDGLRLVYAAAIDPEPGAPVAELRLEDTTEGMPDPAWLEALPAPEGGTLMEVGEGVGGVEIAYTPASEGHVTARWAYPQGDLASLAAYLAEALPAAGFDFDADALASGSSYIDVSIGDWSGQVIFGEASVDDETYTELLWVLTRG